MISSRSREKNRGGGGCRKRRRALKKSPRALKSNTAGFEKKAAGFGNRHGGLCDETPQASEAGTLPVMSESLPVSRCACVVSPKAYLLPGLRVWFHQKFTRHIRSSFKPTKNTSCGFTKSLPVTRSCILYGFDVPFHLFNRICLHTGFTYEQF